MIYRDTFFRFVDMVCILLALAFSSWLMLPPYLNVFLDYTGASTLTIVTFFLTFYMMDCYAVSKEDMRDSIVRVIVAVVIGIIGTGFIFYAFDHWRFPRLIFVLQMVVALTLTIGWRLLYYRHRSKLTPRQEKVIFLGATNASRAKKILSEYAEQAVIIGYTGQQKTEEEDAGTWLGSAEETLESIYLHRATKLVVLDTSYLNSTLSKQLFDAKVHGLKVEDMRSLYERLADRLPISFIQDEWLLLEDGFNLNANQTMRRIKRAFDILFALSLLICTFPIILITAILVRIESKGPAVYKQKRVGLGGKEFTVYKIRSMRQDAEKNGAVWASKEDPRVTRIGKFIRKTRIDELPQLVNVLNGDMSVIGPRPERKDFVIELAEQLPYYTVRHTVKPGITGWAQVSYPYGASIEDARHKLEYDLYYIKNLSALLEIKVILKTIGVILFPTGAR